ncbi:MAG: hypothetical protein AAF648_06825 [Pseudomonadota bacterium]
MTDSINALMQRRQRPVRTALTAALLMLTGVVTSGCQPVEPSSTPAANAGGADWTQPLFQGLGGVELAVTTNSGEAQAYFNQGLALAFAFNHAAADVAFNQAALSDPDCAMCYWGSALVLGPNVNANIDPANAPRAHALATKAQTLAGSTTALEQALIQALTTRYRAEEPDADGRTLLNNAYADAMRGVRVQFPEDANVLALTAEALMDVHPWDFWETDGEIRPWTQEITNTLEQALALDPSHVGAIHLYIHAVEQSPMPERAEAVADTLADLAPAAGHLVHMPAHIYMRIGRYHDATLNNLRAVAADAAFIQACRSNSPIYLAGYIPHNWHFGWVTAAIEGWQSKAYEMAEGTAGALSDELLRAPGMGVAQHFLMQPTFAHMRFADWPRILAAPAPAEDLPYARAIWHYARGLAFANQDALESAAKERDALVRIATGEAMAELSFFNRDVADTLLTVADTVLHGVIQEKAGATDAALTLYAQAVALEDGIPYNEPPDWYFPVRHLLGALQLSQGDAAAAEQTYREDLAVMPENGWALRGLANALREQARDDEAQRVMTRFDSAWKHAEVEIEGSLL